MSGRDERDAARTARDDTIETIEDLEEDRSDNAREAMTAALHEAYHKGRADGKEEIEIEVNIDRERRDFLGKTLAAVGLIGAGAFGYETLKNSEEDIYIADNNIGQQPLDYDLEIGSSSIIEDYVETMMAEPGYSDVFEGVAQDINGENVSMGYLDEQNRIDFYGEEVVSSVEMSDQLYNEAQSELNEILQNQ